MNKSNLITYFKRLFFFFFFFFFFRFQHFSWYFSVLIQNLTVNCSVKSKKEKYFFLETNCSGRVFTNERQPNSREHEDCSE